MPPMHEDANARQKPAANDRPDDTDNDVTDKTEAATPHDLTGQPTSDRANHQPNNQRFR